MGSPTIKIPSVPPPPPDPLPPEKGAAAIRKPKGIADRNKLAAQGTSQFRVPLFGLQTPLT